MKRHSSRLITVLLIGLLIALVIGAMAKKDTPVLIWFIVIGVGLFVGIVRDWIDINKRVPAKRKKSSHPFVVVSGSLPYLAALVLLVGFVYYTAKLLLGQRIDASHGRIIMLTFAAVFIGGSVLYLVAVASRRPNQGGSKNPQDRS
jgi:small-conductance mechanosensitive channel